MASTGVIVAVIIGFVIFCTLLGVGIYFLVEYVQSQQTTAPASTAPAPAAGTPAAAAPASTSTPAPAPAASTTTNPCSAYEGQDIVITTTGEAFHVQNGLLRLYNTSQIEQCNNANTLVSVTDGTLPTKCAWGSVMTCPPS